MFSVSLPFAFTVLLCSRTQQPVAAKRGADLFDHCSPSGQVLPCTEAAFGVTPSQKSAEALLHVGWVAEHFELLSKAAEKRQFPCQN